MRGENYIIDTNATAEWENKEGQIAGYQNGAWIFFTPKEGWVVWSIVNAGLLSFTSSQWVAVSGSTDETPKLGINTSADNVNRLSVKSEATLFDSVGAGHQCKVNKLAPSDTASLLFQTNYSGRAEMGLAGDDDDFHIKVSPDGSNWFEAIEIDSNNGNVTISGRDMSAPTGTAIVQISAGIIIIDTKKPLDVFMLSNEGGASIDNLERINGGLTGQLVCFRVPGSASDTIMKDHIGNLKLAGDFTFTRPDDMMMLLCLGTSWYELSRSDNRA